MHWFMSTPARQAWPVNSDFSSASVSTVRTQSGPLRLHFSSNSGVVVLDIIEDTLLDERGEKYDWRRY